MKTPYQQPNKSTPTPIIEKVNIIWTTSEAITQLSTTLMQMYRKTGKSSDIIETQLPLERIMLSVVVKYISISLTCRHENDVNQIFQSNLITK